MSNKKKKKTDHIVRKEETTSLFHSEKETAVLEGQSQSYLCGKCNQVNEVKDAMKHIEVEGITGREVGLQCQFCEYWIHMYFETMEIIKAREVLKAAGLKFLEYGKLRKSGGSVSDQKIQTAGRKYLVAKKKYKRIYDRTQKHLRTKYGLLSPSQTIAEEVKQSETH